MNHHLNDLYIRRGRLLERIANQRTTLARDVRPVRSTLYATDRLLAYVRAATDYVSEHPGMATIAIAALFIIKPRLVWRWTKRTFFVWQTWRTVRNKWLVFGSRAGS